MSEVEDQTGPPSALKPPEEIRQKVIEALQSCFDPEIPVNIYELGLVYGIAVDEGRG